MADQKFFFDTELRLVAVLASIRVWAAEACINSGILAISVRIPRLGLRSEYNRPSPRALSQKSCVERTGKEERSGRDFGPTDVLECCSSDAIELQ